MAHNSKTEQAITLKLGNFSQLGIIKILNFRELEIYLLLLVHVSNFGGVAESEDFGYATLPTTPLDFEAKFEIFVTLPSSKKSKVKITVLQ